MSVAMDRDELTRYLYGQLPANAGFHQWAGDSFRWVMNQEWFDTLRATFLDVWTPSFPVFLLGFPVTVEPDGGVPHVVQEAAS